MSSPFGNPSTAKILDAETARRNATTNPQAERAVLAALIRDPDGRKILQLGIVPDLFAEDATREGFEAVRVLILDGIQPDAATLARALSPATLIEVESTLASHVSTANLPAWVALLKDCYRERTVQAARSRLAKAAASGSPEHELRAILESISQARQSESRKSTFTALSELMRMPPTEVWLVRHYLPMDSVCVIFGESGCGKSFVTIDLLCHIAAGIPWRGSKVRQGKVLYIAGEGQNGILQRFKAWFEFHGCPDAIDNILIRTIPAALCDKESTAELLAEIEDMPEKPVAIAADTLARNFGPGDENATKDMSIFVASVDSIRKATGATMIVPHHSGHAEKHRGRGSSVLKGAIDVEFCIEKNGSQVSLRNQKMKDAEASPPLTWNLTKQSLPWADDEGVPMSSAVLVPSDEPAIAASDTGRERLPPSQRIAFDALKTALVDHGVEDKGVVSVAEDQWRQAAYKAGISAGDSTANARRMAFNRARDVLVACKKVTCFDARYWIQSNRTEPHKTAQCADVRVKGIDVHPPHKTAHTPYRGVRDVRVCGTPNMDETDGTGGTDGTGTADLAAARKVRTIPPPATCRWDQWNDRLIDPCSNPEPNSDRTGCASCGSVKP